MEDVKEFLDFSNPNNLYVMFAIARSKNNDLTAKQQVVIRKPIRTMEHFSHALNELRAICELRGEKYYIYISINARDGRKGLIELERKIGEMHKQLMMGAEDNNQKFRGRLDKEWYSALMQVKSRSSHYFLVDIDVPNENFTDSIIEMIQDEPHAPKCLLKRRSKNGWHLVTEGFRPDILSELDDVSVNKDGLLFLESVGFDD